MKEKNQNLEDQAQQDRLQRIQEFFAAFIPPGVSLVDELLAERRAEAAAEEHGEAFEWSEAEVKKSIQYALNLAKSAPSSDPD